MDAKIGYVQVVRAPCISPGIFDYVYISKLRLNAAATYSLCVEKEIRYCKNSEIMMNPWCGIKGSNVTLPRSCPSPAFVREFMGKLAHWILLRRMSSRIFPVGSWSSWLCFAKISAARRGHSQIAGKVGRNDPCNFSCAACTDPLDSAFWHNIAKRISCTYLLQSVEPIAWYTITAVRTTQRDIFSLTKLADQVVSLPR